jgi:hypothetical protein
MKKNEFEKIQEKYFRERFRLEGIKKGDLVWEDTGWDICPLVITDVNIDDSYITALEISALGEREKRYENFLTKSEMIEKGFTIKVLEKERRKYKGIIAKVMVPK